MISRSHPNANSPTVLIVGPPWPRSGTARVIQNQVDFYRNRGYSTAFVCVPLHCSYTADYPEWGEIESGLSELGADWTFIAPIHPTLFLRAKYVGWIKHGFRGTALDWIAVTAGSARLRDEDFKVLRELPIALMNVNHVFTLRYALQLLRRLAPSEQVPVILDTHDVQAHLLEERREINPWTHRLDPVERMLHSELSLLQKADVLVHCSEDDSRFFKARLPEKPQVVALPSIDETFLDNVEASDPETDPIDLLFVGQSTEPNCAALNWFFTEVWPLICNRGFRIKIVGQVEMLVRRGLPDLYAKFRPSFVGPTGDLGPFYRGARCVIAPMISGTGVSIKTIEALALGKPFIGTSKAFRGMPMERLAEAGLRSYDTPEGFANAIVHALSDEGKSQALSRAAYSAVFSQKAAFASRAEALQFVAPSEVLI